MSTQIYVPAPGVVSTHTSPSAHEVPFGSQVSPHIGPVGVGEILALIVGDGLGEILGSKVTVGDGVTDGVGDNVGVGGVVGVGLKIGNVGVMLGGGVVGVGVIIVAQPVTSKSNLLKLVTFSLPGLPIAQCS